MRKPFLLFLFGAGLFAPIVYAAQTGGNSAGLVLLRGSGARATALGEAFSTATNDVSAFLYNPASLNTLESVHASFQHQQGSSDDAYSQFMIGAPFTEGSAGISIGYYNGGDVRLFDGNQIRTVTAKSDLVASVGFAENIGMASIGITGKYLQSELAERSRASAVAVDVGAQVPVTSQFRVGGALQNMGSKLKFNLRKERLPQIARAGASYALLNAPVTFMLDIPYFFIDKEVSPTFGIETTYAGVLAVRAGYRSNTELEGFSIGTGLFIQNASLDYSFGLVDDFDSRHEVSVSMRFAGETRGPGFVKKPIPDHEQVARPAPVKKPVEPKRTVVEIKNEPNKLRPKSTKKTVRKAQARKRPKFYVMKQGDTLEKVAKRFYGSTDVWTLIYDLNEELINNPEIIDLVGQKIQLP